MLGLESVGSFKVGAQHRLLWTEWGSSLSEQLHKVCSGGYHPEDLVFFQN